MPYKDPKDPRKKASQQKAQHNWYLKNKESHQKNTNENKRKARAKWQEYKATLCCTKCGQNHPSTLDFHHVIKDDKRSVNQLVGAGQYKEALKETQKCVVLCANCHRIFHHEERLAAKEK